MTKLQEHFLSATVVILGIALATVITVAWTNPTQAPPGGNVSSPINSGATAQTKTGGLNIGGTLAATTVNATSSLCIAGDCKTAWSQVSTSQWTTSGNDIYYATGDAAVGATTFGARLHVFNSSGDNILKLSRGASTSTVLRVGTDGALVVQNQSSDVLTIKNSNVGIGTTNPAVPLDVKGQRSTTPGTVNLAIRNNGDSSVWGVRQDTSSGLWLDYFNGTSWAGRVNVTSDGRITNVANPSADSDVATRGYVLAQNWGLKSVQRGTISIPQDSGQVSGTATITAVNTSKAFVNFLGASAADDSTRNIRIELTNSTTVTAYRQSANTVQASTVSFEVIEFY